MQIKLISTKKVEHLTSFWYRGPGELENGLLMITKRKKEKKIEFVIPIPGVEPGPPGWKPGILTARPYGNYMVG